MRRSLDVAKGAVASAAVALLVVGLPSLLVTSVGWPLPRRLPQLSHLADTITGHQPLETTTVWKILAVILWLAWLQVAAAVVVESVSVARGSVPPSIPGINLAQGLVAPLVAAIVLAWPAGATSRASAAPAPAIERRDPPPATTAETPPPPTAPSTAAASVSTAIEHVVERRDTLWDLAERYLGDGYRAPEIFEINRDRPQPDGRALTDPGLIRPGWILHIPQPMSPTLASSAESVTVEDGDTLWNIAAEELDDGHRFVEILDINRGRPQPDGTALTDPNLIEPGWLLKLPDDAAIRGGDTPAADPVPLPPTPVMAAPASTSIPGPSTTGAMLSPPGSEESIADGPHTDADDDTIEHPPLAPLGLVGGGIATAGIIAVLDRRRRAQLRRRRRGEAPPPLTPTQRDTEHELRAGAEVAAAATVDEVTRAAATGGGPLGLPTIERVEASECRVALVLASPAPAPPGFVASGPAQWQPSEPLVDSDLVGASPMPALVAVGTGPDGSEVLLDLEHPAITTITGDAPAAHRFANALALAVSTSPWSEHANVVAVGIEPLSLDDVKKIESLDAALDEADARVELVAKALDVARCATPAQARAAGDTPDMWTPLVVISTVEPTEPQLARVRALAAGDPHGVALVIRGNAESRIGRVIDIDKAGSATIDGHLIVHAHLIDDAQLGGIGDLLDQADQDCVSVDRAPEPARRRRDSGPAGGSEVLETLLADVDVLVRVLGDVEVVRADQPDMRLPVPKQKSLEAVTYLGLREGRVDREDLQAALWPAGANSAKTFHNTIWAARKMLAQDRDGVELLPEPLEGLYDLSDRVGTDYGLFHELTVRADELDDPAAAGDLLAAALSLVRGEPFMGVGRGYAWAAPHAGIIVAQVVDAAEELAEVRLAGGDWRGAEWAARQGLRVFPCEERLYRLLMRAAHAAGSIPGVHRAFQELAAAVADPDEGVEPDDTLHPETIDLLDELTGQGPKINRASA
ncbi:MAG TPA: BTAD domain-containing putative transcriptional regulator [Acidimicrobiales bacterium]|nr:BTAD domain-containing putative transcriptional regulator [Acidimicrobiales bacterium]